MCLRVLIRQLCFCAAYVYGSHIDWKFGRHFRSFLCDSKQLWTFHTMFFDAINSIRLIKDTVTIYTHSLTWTQPSIHTHTFNQFAIVCDIDETCSPPLHWMPSRVNWSENLNRNLSWILLLAPMEIGFLADGCKSAENRFSHVALSVGSS